MGWFDRGSNVRTEYGHGAGKGKGRWMLRADAKQLSKKRRRKIDRALTKGDHDDKDSSGRTRTDA